MVVRFTYIRRAALLPAFFICIAAYAQPDALAAKSQQAKALMAAGRFEEAIPLYTQLVQSAPTNPGLRLNLALAQHMSGRDREAVPNFEAVLKVQPNLLPALLSLGAARLALNEPQQAVAPLQKALAADPKNQDARGMLAGALMDLRRFEQAAPLYQTLTEAAPEDPRAWYGLGMCYQGIAGAAFERLQQAGPQSAYVAALVADTRVQRRQYRSAYYYYKEALKQVPNLRGVHVALAEIYRKTGHQDWAAAEDTSERTLPPADCKMHPAECQFVGGHDREALTLPAKPTAEALYWQAKAANELATQAFFRLGQLPPSIELHQFRADIARNQNQHLEAVREWKAALQLMPGNPRILQELATSLFLAQDYRAALNAVELLLRADPRNPELNFIAGDSHLRLEEPGKAIPYLQSALAADPKMTAADASLGLALARANQNAAAIPHLERALELDDDGSLHYQLARAYQAAGAREKAAAAMAKYQEILKRVEEQKAELKRETQIAAP